MTSRHRPANRRSHETIAVEHENQRFKVGVGRELMCVECETLGPVVEVFLNAQKANSPIDVLVSDGAILMSMLIQYGCPLADIARAMKSNPNGTPASLFGVAAALISETSTEGA